jgi:hypothetical protein
MAWSHTLFSNESGKLNQFATRRPHFNDACLNLRVMVSFGFLNLSLNILLLSIGTGEAPHLKHLFVHLFNQTTSQIRNLRPAMTSTLSLILLKILEINQMTLCITINVALKALSKKSFKNFLLSLYLRLITRQHRNYYCYYTKA